MQHRMGGRLIHRDPGAEAVGWRHRRWQRERPAFQGSSRVTGYCAPGQDSLESKGSGDALVRAGLQRSRDSPSSHGRVWATRERGGRQAVPEASRSPHRQLSATAQGLSGREMRTQAAGSALESGVGGRRVSKVTPVCTRTRFRTKD